MTRRLFELLLVGSLIVAIGAHWALLQSVAWTSMFIAYSQNASLKEALKKTFDGKHPCNLCKVVQEGKKSERKNDVQKSDNKLDFFCFNELLTLESPAPFSCPISKPAFLFHRTESPPSPPPRRA